MISIRKIDAKGSGVVECQALDAVLSKSASEIAGESIKGLLVNKASHAKVDSIHP
jgi:hypothetical protein